MNRRQGGTHDSEIVISAAHSIQTCRTPNPDIPQAGRGGAAHGGAAGRGGDGQDGTPTGRFAQNTTDPPTLQTIGENSNELQEVV